MGYAAYVVARDQTSGDGVTAFWVFQKLCDMLVGLDLFFSRTMLGWVSVDVLVIGLVILLLWAGFQMALYCHIFARHGYLRVMWTIMAFGSAFATSIFSENIKVPLAARGLETSLVPVKREYHMLPLHATRESLSNSRVCLYGLAMRPM